MSGGLAIAMIRLNSPVAIANEDAATSTADGESTTTNQRPTILTYLLWLGLPAFGSMSLLAVTNHI